MAVLPVGAISSPFTAPSLAPIGGTAATPPAAGFGDLVTQALDGVTATQDTASNLAGQVATGQLEDISEFTTAAAKASLAVSLTAAVRNRAIEAYQEIMRMQV